MTIEQNLGIKVLVANDGAEALEIARKESPNLILSGMSTIVATVFFFCGLQSGQLIGFSLKLITALRSSNETTLIPVILVTAQAGVEGRVEGLLSGADDVICKPFQSRELLARANLHTQLGKRRVELETKFNERTEELKIVTESSPVAFFRINSDRDYPACNLLRWLRPTHRGVQQWCMGQGTACAHEPGYRWNVNR
ncbi:response regulator receiver domain-containing protein [Rhizoctonia solani AG-1 IA]|uniref:Response regulator receiver domain-containing protein n=1 Tax=Thanatephorus cucumeris (strain AG1-IA) TaxID=983506 RepID=L8WSJ2_THACA|nr:response regulator receiver domain-containing protein [Rhizoctonia solani AG-1 IA]